MHVKWICGMKLTKLVYCISTESLGSFQLLSFRLLRTNLYHFAYSTYNYIPYFLDFFPRVLSACMNAGTIRGREQNEGGVNIAQQRMQSRVVARVRFATTQGPRCCQQWALLSQPTSLLRRPLPPLQALQCTRRAVLRATVWVIFRTWSPTHLVWILFCAGTIRRREEIEEIQLVSYLGTVCIYPVIFWDWNLLIFWGQSVYIYLVTFMF